MIEAILNKVMSPAILGDYPALLSSSKKMFQTNMSMEALSSFAKMQLDDMAKWKISYANAAGTGARDYTYSMPSVSLYVCVPDMNSVAKISKKIKKYMNDSPENETVKGNATPRPLNDQGY
jgi:anionic cell wall polymer biosynthesis LytR-Cps2A-Psr (LCP) family protein